MDSCAEVGKDTKMLHIALHNAQAKPDREAQAAKKRGARAGWDAPGLVES